MRDSGVVLRDPGKLHATEEFKPHTLTDCFGKTNIVTDLFPDYSSLAQLDNLFVIIESIVQDQAKIIFTPNIGAYASFRKAYVEMVIDEIAPLPKASKNLVILTRHGMPDMDGEAYPLFSPVYARGMTQEVALALKDTNSKVVVADTDFAADDDDPDNLRLSSAEAVRMGISEGYDNVIMVLIDFVTENTDSIFASRYETFEDYGFAYKADVSYVDQDMPFRTVMVEGKTQIIVAGTPVGEPYRTYLARGIFDALATVLREAEWPQLVTK